MLPPARQEDLTGHRPVPRWGDDHTGVQLVLAATSGVPLLVPSPARSAGCGGGAGSGSAVGWFVFLLPAFQIPPPTAYCETGLSPKHSSVPTPPWERSRMQVPSPPCAPLLSRCPPPGTSNASYQCFPTLCLLSPVLTETSRSTSGVLWYLQRWLETRSRS